MFDTIQIWLPAERAGEIDTNLFCQNITEREDIKTYQGEIKIRGKLKNLSIQVVPTGISIYGSLPKFYQGHNLKNLNLEEIKLALQKIADDLSIPIWTAKMNRIDIGFNISMKYEPKHYFKGLGETQRMHRSNIGENSLYYKNSTTVLNFYDKNLETFKTSFIPSGYSIEKNLLRYELRLIKRLNRNFNNKEILVADLIDKNFCQEMLAIWANKYFSIKKNNLVNFDPQNCYLPKDYLEYLALIGIEAHRNNIPSDINILKSIGAFNSKEYYSRLLSKIREISSNPKFSIASVFNEELDSKIEMILAKWDSG